MTNGVKFLVASLGIVIIFVALGIGAYWGAISSQTPISTVQQTTIVSRDLIAQEAMADWAMVMAITSAGGLLITSIGTFLILQQVKLTKIAVKDTG